MAGRYDRINGAWTKTRKRYDRISGAWTPVKKRYDKVNGLWTPSYAGYDCKVHNEDINYGFKSDGSFSYWRGSWTWQKVCTLYFDDAIPLPCSWLIRNFRSWFYSGGYEVAVAFRADTNQCNNYQQGDTYAFSDYATYNSSTHDYGAITAQIGSSNWDVSGVSSNQFTMFLGNISSDSNMGQCSFSIQAGDLIFAGKQINNVDLI